jgi:hypothetical protein
MVHSKGLLEVGGACRCGKLGSTLEDGGSGEGERSGWEVLYDSSREEMTLGGGLRSVGT